MTRRSIAAWLICLCLTGVSRAQNLLLEDYRPPVSSATALRLSFEYDYTRIGSEEIENRGNLFANHRYFYDSLPFAYSIESTLTADRSEDGRTFFSVVGNERARAFVWGDLFAGGELRRGYRSDGTEDAEANGVVGIGYGRFINGTPLAKAVRMEDWLLELGQLYDDLPAETMIELAQIIQRENEFRAKFGDTFRQEWFEAMAAAIRESGMLKVERLDATALRRMDEVLLRERVFDRFFGWEVSVGAGADIFVLDEAQETARTAEAAFRLAKPLGWRTQWNESFTVSSPFGTNIAKEASFLAVSELSYEFSDRIDLLLTHRLRLDRTRNPLSRSYEIEAAHRLQGTFVFFVENALTFNVNGTLSDDGGRLRRAVTATFGYRLF